MKRSEWGIINRLDELFSFVIFVRLGEHKDYIKIHKSSWKHDKAEKEIMYRLKRIHQKHGGRKDNWRRFIRMYQNLRAVGRTGVRNF